MHMPANGVPRRCWTNVRQLYDEALELGTANGYRNAQISVLGPHRHHRVHDGLRHHRHRARHRAHQVQEARRRGLPQDRQPDGPGAPCASSATRPTQVEEIIAYINERETIEGAPGLRPEHLPVFDCAFKPVNGERSIHYMGHIRMMGAVQPFLSGAISKTVNMPEAATAEEIEQVYLEGWKQGLKAIAIYRDGSKRSQPLSTGKKKDEGASAEDRRPIESLRRQLAAAQVEATRPHRRRLPAERTAITHKFEIAGHEGYITVGLYPDGQPGEIFLKMAKEGSTDQRPDGHARDVDQPGAPVRRAAARPGQQVRPRAVRARRLHRQPGDPDRQVDRGLHLPLARLPLPAGARTRAPSG